MAPTSPASARTRIPRGTLTRAEILRATVELIAQDPDQPITMERVARALGTRPMSLYTHVRNRDDLIAGAIEHALDEWQSPTAPEADWTDRLRVWCRSLRDFARHYPPLVMEMTRGGRFPPALLHQVAALTRILRDAGLTDRPLADAVRWIPQTVLGAITLELARPDDLRSAHDENAAIWASLGSLDDTDRDALVEVLQHYPTSGHADDLFDYTVERLLDGVRTQLTGPTR